MICDIPSCSSSSSSFFDGKSSSSSPGRPLPDTAPDFLSCPYDASHVIGVERYPYHVTRCRAKHRGSDSDKLSFRFCLFNARHEIPEEDIGQHRLSCPDRFLYLEEKASMETVVRGQIAAPPPTQLLSSAKWEMDEVGGEGDGGEGDGGEEDDDDYNESKRMPQAVENWENRLNDLDIRWEPEVVVVFVDGIPILARIHKTSS